MIIQFKRSENKKISKFFNSKEFVCPCKKCDKQYISQELLDKLDLVREKYGHPIIVNSGYRCPLHNKAVGGKENSSHMAGLAADISPAIVTLDDLDELYDLCYNIFDNIGDGRVKKFIHVDVRPPKSTGKRLWLY